MEECNDEPSAFRNGIKRLKADSCLYKEVIDSNIFIVGGTAAGKTELMQILQKEMSYLAIDVGKLFRLIAYLIVNDKEGIFIEPDVRKIKEGDILEIKRVLQLLLVKTKSLEKSLMQQARFKKSENGTLQFFFQEASMEELLETPEIDDLVPVIAKSPKIRTIIWRWINKSAYENGGLILTGHNLEEINTSDFIVIHLKVDLGVAGERLIKKSGGYYSNIVSAIQSVESRNSLNRIKYTENILEQVHGVTSIDTTHLGIEEVAVAAVRGLESRIKRKSSLDIFFKENAIERDEYKWLLHPVMSVAKERFETLIDKQKIAPNIAKFDLLMQCLIHLPSYQLEEIFSNWKSEDSDILFAYLQRKTNADTEILTDKKIRDDVFSNIIAQQTYRLGRICESAGRSVPFSDTPYFSDLVQRTVIDKDSALYEEDSTCRHLIIPLHGTAHVLRFRPVAKEIGAEYSYQLHYLHSPRYDEFMGFGAFLDDLPYPIAWVSYSKHDRFYKKELLEYIGLESHNVLEMTRAWNAPWAPKNTMSTLFNYSAKELRTIWEKMETKGITDKSLVGISTTINPNLGFTGKSFSGASFITTALRPATLTYYQEEYSAPIYVTRREAEIIGDNSSRGTIFDARIPQMPLNEMILAYSPKMQEKLSKGKIYKIDPESYLNK
jgi:cytidylate kinase